MQLYVEVSLPDFFCFYLMHRVYKVVIKSLRKKGFEERFAIPCPFFFFAMKLSASYFAVKMARIF